MTPPSNPPTESFDDHQLKLVHQEIVAFTLMAEAQLSQLQDAIALAKTLKISLTEKINLSQTDIALKEKEILASIQEASTQSTERLRRSIR
jgi:hypothetical protein